jgi:low temperature requirement protein LtrA
MSGSGKRVSWVELYLDLVFVLAVGQLSHLIVAHPEMRSVWIALGLFVTLWWTWVGFAVLYNRHGADQSAQRLLFLAGSVPTGVAAVAIAPASTGDSAVFAASLAVIRLVLAGLSIAGDDHDKPLRRRITRAWAIGIAVESGAMLTEDRAGAHRARRDHDFAALAPTDPTEAVDAHHFAERFGLFLIILLGEVVVEAGQASVSGHDATTPAWAALIAAMVLAAALWWLYFDSVAEANLKVLHLSGGSPTMARAIFAVGHMLPAFALLMTAAGVGLLLEGDPPRIAYWLACVGIGIYLAGTRALTASGRVPRIVRLGLLLATFQLARLGPTLTAHRYVWLLAGWAVLCAVLTTGRRDGEGDQELDRDIGGHGAQG